MLTDRSVNTPPSSPPQEGFSGLIERVTFHSEETGFAVLRVKAKGHRELVTVVGALANVNAGEWITAQGNWVQDKEHGLQFKATFLKCSPPTSREGIEKYLASGLIKGIGPVYAKKLVEKFGEEIFTVIDHYSVKLEEVDWNRARASAKDQSCMGRAEGSPRHHDFPAFPRSEHEPRGPHLQGLR